MYKVGRRGVSEYFEEKMEMKQSCVTSSWFLTFFFDRVERQMTGEAKEKMEGN